MPMSGPDLAQDLADALGEKEVSDNLKGWANAVVTEIQSGVVTFGNIPGPHPITALVGPRLAALIAQEAGYPGPTPELIAYAGAITAHVMTGTVTYKTPLPNPPPLPPPAAWFLDGTISGLAGPVLAQQIASALGQPAPSSELLKKATAIVNHIQTNAVVTSGVIS